MNNPPRVPSVPSVIEAINSSGCSGLNRAKIRERVQPGDLAILIRWDDDQHYWMLHLRNGKAIPCIQPWGNFYSFWQPLERELTEHEKILAVKGLMEARNA